MIGEERGKRDNDSCMTIYFLEPTDVHVGVIEVLGYIDMACHLENSIILCTTLLLFVLFEGVVNTFYMG